MSKYKETAVPKGSAVLSINLTQAINYSPHFTVQVLNVKWLAAFCTVFSGIVTTFHLTVIVFKLITSN